MFIEFKPLTLCPTRSGDGEQFILFWLLLTQLDCCLVSLQVSLNYVDPFPADFPYMLSCLDVITIAIFIHAL